MQRALIRIALASHLSGCFSDLPYFAGSCHNGVLWQRRNTLRRPENLGNPQK
ncbi:hypothetical protein BBCT_1325 [Bifidobacterium catenulatum DSM 16992 = JCM 1194 = LMG 11043]|uniref:Lipoprotein n=2 Tax=Bifidobacterium catenulatum DSM 16992 = JCM 1194 = LMG 11043 TaxID=566552 RepID=A0ABM7EWG3_9BIFI|nr:hypothetical protein BIFCAT_00326 [Bifidobacterium catenulatum DSM 16992 = JCM 1194 = LMG 11043]BAR02293.1 hypothetical protein BBCT_1325 [Bifidobacterium catenulatum DSM 16992 = JCM 1194 = LMG 11043]